MILHAAVLLQVRIEVFFCSRPFLLFLSWFFFSTLFFFVVDVEFLFIYKFVFVEETEIQLHRQDFCLIQ
jgi:hypothetical protein